MSISSVFAQTDKKESSPILDSTKITFFFNSKSVAIDLDIPNNEAQIQELIRVVERRSQDSLTVSRVNVNTGVAPEGAEEANSTVIWNRLRHSVELIKRYVNIPAYNEINFDYSSPVAQTWKRVEYEVRKSNLPNKQKVISVIQSGGNIPAKLASLDPDQRTWKYIQNEIYPKLRQCEVVIYFKKRDLTRISAFEDVILPEKLPLVPRDINPHGNEPVAKPVKEKPKTKRPRTRTTYTPLFALNTNLLYDLAITPNLSIEIPIKDKLSFSLMAMSPWWCKSDNSWCYELQYIELEGKRWMGERKGKDLMTGHALGLYAGVGYYDLESHSKGYQGEICVNVGVSYHYAKAFGTNERWRFQAGIGLGVMRTKYRYYEGRENNNYLVWQKDGKFTWIGPNKLELTLGYLFHKKKVTVIDEEGGMDDDE